MKKFYIQETKLKNVIIIYNHTSQRKLLWTFPLLLHCMCVYHSSNHVVSIIFNTFMSLNIQEFSQAIKPYWKHNIP